ncbi:MAG: macro domain-containing protein, partial [Erysipelotrichaceae bacterium]|nr:macro domain-containing protein [Erysipelotrichaceae bacterium]
NCIHTYAGIELRQECYEKMEALKKKYGPDYEQPVGEPMLTKGYNLPCKRVIHVVGPMVTGFLNKGLEEDLRRCYVNTLDLCKENGIRSVAFCCISTGVFRFPNEKAAKIAVECVEKWIEENEDGIDRVIFNVFLDKDLEIYERLLRKR